MALNVNKDKGGVIMMTHAERRKKFNKASLEIVEVYRCPICKRIFERANNFNDHIRSHGVDFNKEEVIYYESPNDAQGFCDMLECGDK